MAVSAKQDLFLATLLGFSLALLPLSVVHGEEVLVLEEVLVSASRRVESLQEVPMSVSAFSQEFLQDSGVNQLTDLEQYTPNLKINASTDSRSTSIRIRGIGSVGSNSGIDPSVGVFIDGVYQGRAGMSISDLIDVQRVEVLRGPQGTLYGKNTSAGAISVITGKPTEQRESLIELGYDSNKRLEARGMVNVPLGNSGHGLRLTGFGIEGDDLFSNTFTGEGINNASKYGARARLLLNLDASDSAPNEGAERGELLFTLDYTKEDTNCCALAVIDYNGLSTVNAPATNLRSAELSQQLGLNASGMPRLQFNSFEDSEGFSPPAAAPFGDDYWLNEELSNKVEVGGLSVEWNKELNTLGAITFLNAWRHYESYSVFDGDFTAYDAVSVSTDVELDQYSSELRLVSTGGQTVDYQGGLYAYYSEFDSIGAFTQRPALVNNIGIGGGATLGLLFPNGSVNVDTNVYTTTSYAAFGQLVWNISEQLSATFGLRYTYEKKQREGSQLTTPTIALDIPPVAGPDIFYDNSRSDSDMSPAFNIRYFFESGNMLYASVSRGFKSGGFNQRREVTGSTGEFDEEIATNHELGWKTSWLDRRLQFNGTLFFVNYDDFQSQTFDGSSVKVNNAGNLESSGAELELVYLPAAGFTVGTAVGYNEAEYESFDNGQCTVEQTFQQFYVEQNAQSGSPATLSSCTQDLAGQPLANAPEWTVSTFVQHERTINDSLMATVRLEHSYTDGFYLDEDLDENLKNDAVHLLNLRLSMSNPARDWEVALWARNILDEEYFVFGVDVPTLGGYAGVVAPEAAAGITFRLRN